MAGTLIRNLTNKVFPKYAKAGRRTTTEMFEEGAKAKPEGAGPTAEELLASMDESAKQTAKQADAAAPPVEPPDAPVEPTVETAAPVEPTPAEAPTGPLRDIEPPSLEQVNTPLAEPLEPRTRARNINVEFLDVKNVEDIGRVLERNAEQMDWGDDPVKSFEQTRSNVEGRQEEIFKQVLTEDPAALSDEQLLAGGDVLLTLVSKQEELAARIASGRDVTPELELEFDLISEQAVMIQDYLQGKTRQAARALNSMKVTRQIINSYNPRAIKEATAGTNIQLRAQTILDMKAAGKKPGEIIKVAGEQSRSKKFFGAVVNARNGGLLTGVKTQMVNMFNNTFFGALRTLVVKPTAAAVGTIRTRGEANADRVYLGEVSAEMVGTLQALGEAIDSAWAVWKQGTFKNAGEYISMFGGRKIDEVAEDDVGLGTATADLVGGIPGIGGVAKAGMEKTGVAGAMNAYHRGVSAISFGSLTAQDEAFKHMHYRKTLLSLALRDAYTKGLKGEAAADHMADILENVTHDLHQKALHEAEIQTFTNRHDVANLLNKGANLIVEAGNEVPIVKWWFPFTRTPTAILDRSIKISPFARMQKQVRETIEKGGPEADMAMAELTLGVSFMTIMSAMVAMGLMTGQGPSRRDDPGGMKRDALEATGWQPNSVRSGGKQVSLKRGFDPVMLVPLAAAQAAEAAQFAGDEPTAADYLIGGAFMVMSQFKDASYMEGLQQVLKIANDEVSWSDYLAREAATVAPTLLKDIDAVVRYMGDEEGRPYVPKTDDFAVALSMNLRARVPFVAPPMVARYWDGTVATPGGGDMMFAWNTFTPIRSSWMYNSEGRAADPATSALVQANVPISRVDSEVVIDKDSGWTMDLLGIPKGWELYEMYAIEVGKYRRAYVESVTDTEKFRQAMQDGMVQKNSIYAQALSDALRDGKEKGRISFLKKINSDSFDWTEYGGEETRKDMRGEGVGDLMTLYRSGMATEEEIKQLRDRNVKNMPARSSISPPEGEGSDVRKKYHPGTDEIEYVPKM